MEKKAIEKRKERALVRSAKQGDQRAIEALYHKHYPFILNAIKKKVNDAHLAEDLALEAFTKAITQIHRYDPYYAFGTWLRRIVVNHYIDYYRKNKLETYSLSDTHDQVDHHLFRKNMTATTPEDEIIRQQRHAQIRDTVNMLKENHRQIIDLRFFKELSYDEIAERLGIPIGTVKAQIHRAKHILAELLLQSKPSM